MNEALGPPEEADRNINIDINLNAPQHELQRSIQRCIYLVAGGLLSSSQIEETKLKLPDSTIEMTFDPSLIWSTQDVRSHLQEWILLNGIRDSAESLGSFLALIHSVCSVWSLMQKQSQGQTLTIGDWQKTMEKEAEDFAGGGFPNKLKHLQKGHGVDPDPVLTKHMLSINKARNCLVHREGVVGKPDVTDGCLVVSWRRVKLIAIDADGEQDLVPGFVTKQETPVGIKFLDEERSFGLGDRITFSAQEFQHLAWSMYLFGVDMGIKVSKWGQANGFVSLPATDTNE